jgi:hypothetical protein
MLESLLKHEQHGHHHQGHVTMPRGPLSGLIVRHPDMTLAVLKGSLEALFTLYFLALLVQALIERELRLAIKRERLKELPLYPEQRSCKRPTTEQILRLFSLAERHTLFRRGRLAQVFPAELTDLQHQVLHLLGVPEDAFRG